MEKRAIVAFGFILLIWIVYSTPFYQRLILGRNTARPQSVAPAPSPNPGGATDKASPPAIVTRERGSSENWDRNEKVISVGEETAQPEHRQVIVEGDLFRGVLDAKGGVIRSWRLKRYRGVDSPWVELIPEDREGGPTVQLSSEDGVLDFSQALFQTAQDSVRLSRTSPSGTVEFRYKSPSGPGLVKRYIFSNENYAFRTEIELIGGEQAKLGSKYFIRWGGGLRVTEPDRESDLNAFRAFCRLGDEVVDQSLGTKRTETKVYSGETKWVGVRSKYFFAAIIPVGRSGEGSLLSGRPIGETTVKDRQVAAEIEMRLTPGFRDQFLTYLGPVDYDTLKQYNVGLERVVDLGWSLIRPISVVILRMLVWLHQWISNYGLVILVLSIIVKIVLFPLTYKSMVAAQGMQTLQPKIEALKERHKGDTQRLNRETMTLYKKHGVNPLGGCLPLLLQMPILYALYAIFSSTIELRGARFFMWIDDLSLKDPYYILPILMGVTMMIQSKMTMKDPRQAAMVYMMPVMMFIFMHNLPSGLILYWTMINILTIIQQYIQNRFIGMAPVGV